MDDQHADATHYAILIGINAYPEKPLKGCVRDVRDIRKYLRGMSKPPQIRIFTAPSTNDLNSSHQAERLDSSHPAQVSESSGPDESPELWPTYGNVTSSLKEMSSRAKAGDFIYIHYSGHGTRIPNSSTGDLALVLLEGATGTNPRYLEGLELASLIGDMVRKELTVTLVLDCCFSGSVMRDDSSARYLRYDPKVPAAYGLAPGSSLKTKASCPVYRNASMLPNWLVHPDGYTILTACGPTEIAKELWDEEGQRHGVLSWFLLRSLQNLGDVRESRQNIYRHLCARFQETQEARKNEQNPILYGNKTLSFFGPASPGMCSAPVSVIKKLDGSLQIGAGQAHGIYDGDQFTVHPWASAERDLGSKSDPILAKVTQARALVSDVELLDTSVRVVNLPTMTLGQTNASFIYDLMEHLVKFKMAKNLANKELAIPFRESFSIQIIDCSGRIFQPESLVKVKHNEEKHLRPKLVIENKGSKDLYLHIYDMGPHWQVKNLLRANHKVIPAGKDGQGSTVISSMKLTMTVPRELCEKGHRQCDDIIEVFVTAQPTSFDLLELPKFGKSFMKSSITRPGREGGGSSSEDWAVLNFFIRTYIDVVDIDL
ncbi:MAG: hypothetical protein Q9187_001267 [Circinaria calcarea]